MSIILSPYPKLQFISDNGVPMANCLLYTYQAGTNSPIATFVDGTGLAYNTNPIVLDAGGRANVWIDSNIAYKFVLMNKNNTVLFTVDNINSSTQKELIVVNTVADLKAINTTTLSAASVLVLGYYLPNDGGGGEFMFVSGSTQTADNGVVVQPTIGTGKWFRICDSEINILWYGAKGNGATDNASFIQAANTYAASQNWNLFIPEGVYVINSNPELTVPVRFATEAILQYSSFTMNISPMFSFDDYTQHFSLSSTAACNFGTSLTDIYVDWFGAKGDGSFTSNVAGTDDTAAIQYTVNSATIGSYIVFNSAKKYWCGQITCKPGVHFRGSQSYENDTETTQNLQYLANLQYNGTGTSFFELSNSGTGGLRGITVKDLVIDGSAQATTILNLQTTGSAIMDCTLRNATNGIVLTGASDSSSNRFFNNNLRNFTTAITTSGVGTANGVISENIFIDNTTDIVLDPLTSYTWLVHDNFHSNIPVIGVVNHFYGTIDYQNAILGPTHVTSTAPCDSQILSSVGGWADNSSTFTPNETNAWNNKHLLRYSSTLDITGSRVHDSLGYDLSGRTPRQDTRAWYERGFDGTHHWGDLSTEFMTLSNSGVLSFSNASQGGVIPLAAYSGGANFCFLNYKVCLGVINLMSDSWYSVGTSGAVSPKLYPCYSTTTPTTSQFATTTNTVTIPFALGSVTFGGFSGTNVLQVGQYVILTVGSEGTWANYNSANSHWGNATTMMYGQVTAYDNVTPLLTINILYYKSHGATNFVTSGNNFYIASAFPFLMKQPTTWHSEILENVGSYNTSFWTCGPMGIIFDEIEATISGNYTSITAQLSDLTPSTES